MRQYKINKKEIKKGDENSSTSSLLIHMSKLWKPYMIYEKWSFHCGSLHCRVTRSKPKVRLTKSCLGLTTLWISTKLFKCQFQVKWNVELTKKKRKINTSVLNLSDHLLLHRGECCSTCIPRSVSAETKCMKWGWKGSHEIQQVKRWLYNAVPTFIWLFNLVSHLSVTQFQKGFIENFLLLTEVLTSQLQL